ncbi:hypothetical protein JMM81_14490 [Bacillus sp. V3B]|uniref:hypothetical protein n=1 Tax=Bacillus sp. V3B TaxID=2804915 RepID=UPI002108670D|nr:hypothetical protein [Bacillus sp. V3B]MCQ6276133.1 hypothetical protein [Bacillus sp. V3B]
MKRERKNAIYPPYQFQPFSSPYNQPRMDYKGYEYAINHQRNAHKSRKHSEQNNIKHHESFSSENIEEKKLSKRPSNPVLYVPPIVNDHELRHTESKNQNPTHNNDQKNKLQQENQNHSNKFGELFTTQEPERIVEEEERRNMKRQEMKEGSSFDRNEKSSLPFTELNTKNDDHKNDESIKDESSSFKDESSMDEELSRKHIAMLDESSSTEGETFFLYDESSSYEDESSLFTLSNSMNDKPYLLEESPLFEESSSSEESSSCYNESSSFEESSCNLCESSSMDGCLDSVSRETSLPIVKLPVLLAEMEIDIDVFDTFVLPCPVSNVSKIDWSVHSLDCKVLLPSPNVLLKGILMATIEYIEENATASLHTIKIKVPWEKVKVVDWNFTPKLPSSHQAEYMYQGNNKMDVQLHRESIEQYAEPIQSDLEHIHYIWHDELISKDEMKELNIQGGVSLQIQLKQSKYIDLNTLKWL